MTDIAFVGLGAMGAPMALHLLRAGHRVVASGHRRPPPAELVDNGLRVAGSLADAAASSEVVIMIVPDTPQVEEVLFADAGIASGLNAGSLVIDMSSISPVATRRFGERISALGGDYLDAPVSGGENGAKAASLSIMVGGSEAAFERALPLFRLVGKNITRIGELGDGQTAKAANQIIVALTIAAVSEALVFASKAGADPARVREALAGGFASSRILEVHGERMLKRDFAPGFRIDLHQKDLDIALATGRALGISLPNTAVAQQMFAACVAAGGGAWDHSAMVRAIEQASAHSLT